MDSISQPATPSIESIGRADLLVGILADFSQDDLASASDALRTLPGPTRIVVLQDHASDQPPPTVPEASDFPARDSSLFLLPWSKRNPGATVTPVESVSTAYESIFEIGEKLDVRAFCLIASKFENAQPEWVSRLAQPLLEGFDFVAPCYARRKLEGLLNSSIVSPLTRSLYGRRIQNPMGPDLGISRRLYQEVLSGGQDAAAGNGMRLLAGLAPVACCGDFKVCQAYLGSRIYPPLDWTNVSSLLTEILGPVFLAMEKNASRWQQTRNSSPVPTLNEPTPPVSQSAETVEIARLVNSFQLGMRDLREIWRLVLPPATLFELQRISPDKFCIPDELWAKIVYDFALAHRLRTINRTHLLRSLAPLYLGWVASYAREFENSDPRALARRLERLSLAYEASKPYLISRWRWPDRFNP